MSAAPKIDLIKTCSYAPEQYDAFIDDRFVGYLRLRHGYFTTECPDVGGTLVFEAYPEGDGAFMEHERAYYLRQARAAIRAWLKTQPTEDRPKP